MAIHCMLLTKENLRIVQNFLSEFKDKYDCMQTFDMVRSMISAWQSANFKDGEEPTMPTKDEIEQFIQSQLGKDKQSSVAPIKSTNIADYVNTEGRDKGFLTKKGEELLSTTFDKNKFNKGTFSVALYPGPAGTILSIGFISPKGNKFYAEYSSSSTRKTWDLLNSEQQTVTDVTSEKYWNIINTIVPKSLRDLVDSGEYYKMDTTDTEKGGEASLIKRSELEEYFEKEYNVFMQGRSLDYNTKQINKALSPVQEYSNEEQSIIDKAKKNGTFMKAPNGKPTNLTEKQWVQVRTKAFKDWFGDWEAEVRRKNRLEVIKPYIKNVVPIKKILPFIDSGLVNAENTPKNKLYIILTDFFNSLPIPKELNVYYLDSKIRKDLPYYKNWTGYTSNDNTGFYIIDDSDKYQYNKIDSINSNISTFIHELTHALLMKSIEENKEFRNKVQNLYDYTIQYLKNTNIYDRYKDMYGFTDIHEFISDAVSNISFMRVLDDIPSPNKEKNSIFDDFLNAIKTLFKELRGGFTGKEHSILDDIFNLFNTDNFNIYEHNNVSKVVDENGEPLVVYHYTDNENLSEFSTEFDNYFSKEGGTKNAIFFTTDNVVPGSEDNFLTSRKAKLSLFLNIKNLEVFHGTKEDLHKQRTSYREIVNKSSKRKGSENGIVLTGFDDNKKENQTIYVVHNSNQIKSAINNTGAFSKYSNNIYDTDSKEAPVQDNGKITPVITTEATPYTKGLPQKNPNTAYLFTENAQAYVTSLQLDDSWIERGYNKGNSVKTGVSDVRGTNQAGIRASSYNTYGATNISKNAFGIIVKKYQQKLSQSSFLSKEGQFEDTDSDFELFKQLNLHMFNNLNNFNAENIVLPNQIALGKSALPLRFVKWLKEELSKRFNANFIIEKNTRADYDGYGIRVVNANIKVKEAPIQEDDKSYAEDLARCARQMSPIERKHRVERITRMFSSIVNSKLKDKLATYNDKIQAETNPKVKNDLLFGRKKITRFSIIKSEGVQSIMMEVRKAFQVYVDAPLEAKIAIEKQQILSVKPNLNDRIATNIAKSVAERKTKAFQNVLNNFQVLAEEALGNLALTEGISVNLNSNFVLNTQENSDTFNEEGKQTNQGDVFEKEESLKDGWMTDVRQVATFDSLTARVRQAISNMVRYDSTGNVDRDDLGDNIYLNAGYVHSELIQALRNMISAEDMIPMLEQLSKKKVWVKQIINELNNDNQLFTEFYRAYRKDYVNYFIQKVSTNSDTSTSTKVMSINGAEGTAHYFDEWRDNYEYGNVLTTDSIYDKNGDIQLKNAKVGLDLVDSLLDIFEERETIAENLTDENIARIKKAMNMLGVSVDSETLENALKFNLDNKAFKPAVNVLLSNLRTIYYDLNKGNEKVKDGEYVDLLNIHGTAFNNIAEVINKVDEDTIESSVRQGDKTMYAHINPSYVTTLIKKLQREDTYKQVLDDYRVCNWFNKNGKWRNSILEEIENNAEVRSNLKHVVLLQYNRKEYAAWTDLDATLALYNMYMTGAADRSGSETYGYYQIPMLSDAQSAEFIKFKRYKKGYEEKLLDKFKDLVYQEIDRINLVKERATTKNHIDPIANFDMDDKKMGGAEFKFFPELNQKDQSGKTFLQAIDEAKQISMDEVDNLIKNTIKSIMDSRFNEAVQHYKDIGLYDRIGTEKNARFKYVNVYSEEGMNDRMREWFWNSTYFTSQFIELTTTDLAYYKNLEDFQKRNKQDHAPAERLNTLATWNGKPVLVNNDGSRRTVRRVIYLKDNILPANSMDSINEILEARVKDKDDAFTAYDKAAIMSIFSKVNVADAQAYNTLPSFRSTQIMAGMWSDAEETAYNNIMNNKWTASDFLVLWNTRKPYLYTQKNQPDGMGGIMKVPTQHKNSEFLLLTGAMFGQILHSSKLQALNDFMVKNNIDSAMFESAVKDGLQGAINLNNATNYASTMAVLENATRLNGKENPNVVHEFDYNDYGIQTSTPEHGIDKVQLVGTQIRRLISSDMNPNRDPNFKLKYKDREFTQEEWFNYFNAINTANIQEAFKEVSDKFNDIHEVEKELIREVRSNPRYGTDLIKALTLDENGNFNIPLIDPSQTLRIQALLNSILKNRVTKQKINGGALIQASPFGLDESKQPQIVYNEDGSIKYFEAYLPCPTEELYNALLDPNTHELDINKKDSKGNYIVPEKYREVIGYRV